MLFFLRACLKNLIPVLLKLGERIMEIEECACVCVPWGRKACCFGFPPSGNLDWESFNSKEESSKHLSIH